MSVRALDLRTRDRIMAENGITREEIQPYQRGDVPTHYVPLVYAMSSMVGPIGETLATMTRYANALPAAERNAAFRFDTAPTQTMREGTKHADGTQIDKGFGSGPILLVHSDLVGALLAENKLVRGDLDAGVSCAFVPGQKKDPDGCYHIKGFASKLADRPKDWTPSR